MIEEREALLKIAGLTLDNVKEQLGNLDSPRDEIIAHRFFIDMEPVRVVAKKAGIPIKQLSIRLYVVIRKLQIRTRHRRAMERLAREEWTDHDS
jgi:hypothetical protein